MHTEPLVDAQNLDAVRLEKATTLRAAGKASPYRFIETHQLADLKARFATIAAGETTHEDVRVQGITGRPRRMKTGTFATMRDDAGAELQVYFPVALADYALVELVDNGDWLGIKGKVMRTKRGELSVLADEWHVLAKCIVTIPSDGLDEENKQRRPWLYYRTEPAARVRLAARAKIKRAIRLVLDEQGYQDMDTPYLNLSYGGAAARPFTTRCNELDGTIVYLPVSPEPFLKEMVAAGYPKVYTVARNFRNEGADNTHNPEFDAVEAYAAGRDYTDMMDLAERLIQAAALATNGTLEATWRATRDKDGNINPMNVDLAGRWRRVTMRDLVFAHYGIHSADLDELLAIIRKENLDSAKATSIPMAINTLFEGVVQTTIVQPTFVMDYPVENSPLTREHRTQPGLTERFELFICGVEFANAYSELCDPIEQERRLREQEERRRQGDDEAHPLDRGFVDGLRTGFPTCGGLGIGIDRLAMLLTGASAMREVWFAPLVKPLPEE